MDWFNNSESAFFWDNLYCIDIVLSCGVDVSRLSALVLHTISNFYTVSVLLCFVLYYMICWSLLSLVLSRLSNSFLMFLDTSTCGAATMLSCAVSDNILLFCFVFHRIILCWSPWAGFVSPLRLGPSLHLLGYFNLCSPRVLFCIELYFLLCSVLYWITICWSPLSWFCLPSLAWSSTHPLGHFNRFWHLSLPLPEQTPYHFFR